MTDATGKKTKCDTTVDLTGEESGGGCLYCDFELDTTATVSSENGTDCDYQSYAYAMLVEGDVYSDIWLGWSDTYTTTYGTYNDLLWFGYGVPGYPGPYWQLALVSYNKYADYTDGLLSWSRDTQYLGNNLQVDSTCGAGVYTGIYYPPYAGSPNYYGNYTSIGSLNCSYNKPYDKWSFYGVDDTYAAVSIDTIAPDSAFDPMFYVTTDDLCMEAVGDENFDCSFPGTNGFLCPSVRFPTTKGEHYNVWVLPYSGGGDCDNPTADYLLWLNTKGDPSLSKAKGGELWPPGDIISAVGSAKITMEKETD